MKKSINTKVSEETKTSVSLTSTVLEQIKKITEELKVRQNAAQQVQLNLELIVTTILSQSGYDLSKVTNLSIDDEKSVLLFDLKDDKS